ncbi:sensor histidine kinase [Desulforhopalus singaporensis]|uniref:histidine kinase n=1 Tax=Desulforhopalus singaporensis TaxID=91360 RepID=A0A1H0N340_9BACT|nr:ATP-binding protein [Desulforhopalus singaporensis]SDO87098.1 two-component system, OmpR family, phosphate regulon sensor histidine kinase PhoR [Desulforhopalus singaporensis]
MKPVKLIWQIFPTSVLIILLGIAAVGWYGSTILYEFYLQQTESDLEARGRLISQQIYELVNSERSGGLRDYCIALGRDTGTRITVIDSTGKVLADSNEDPGKMDNHRHRQEIEKAFAGSVGKSRRYSRTLGENLIYVALPLHSTIRIGAGENKEAGNGYVVRTSVSVASLDRTFAHIRLRILFGSIAVIVLAGLATLFICKSISNPLERMTRNARLFSTGDFSEKMLPMVPRAASKEVVTLAASMDRMAALLDEKIKDIVTHRNQLETVFSSMVEAMIAVDLKERIISINDAAARLFHVDRNGSEGKLLQQVGRNVALQEMISLTLETGERVEKEIVFQDTGQERFIKTRVVALSSGQGKHVGALAVLNDVTQIRKLEGIRTDFVANVSHELRTPITSIRGYVETLLDGALDNREDAEKFLGIVLKQSRRLTSIIDELLHLSKIEQEASDSEIEFTRQRLLPVVEAAVQTCRVNAADSGVFLQYRCADNIHVKMNGPLMEQALVNLIVNAITHSEKGGTVNVEAEVLKDAEGQGESSVKVTVRDTGCGIAKEHLPRLFERFYRCDKARSRNLGGTGLGLAIVKHIVQAHDARVEVESVDGEGSAFSLILNGPV